MPGVKNVQIDFEKKQAIVIAEKGKVNARAFIEALSKIGFQGMVESK